MRIKRISTWSLIFVLTLSLLGCKSTKKEIEAWGDIPCQEIVKKHFIVNTNGFNITKMVQQDDKLYLVGQISGCNMGKFSVMWNGVSKKSNPPQVTIEFKAYEAGLCDMMVDRIWCIDLTEIKNANFKKVELGIAEMQNKILLEF